MNGMRGNTYPKPSKPNGLEKEDMVMEPVIDLDGLGGVGSRYVALRTTFSGHRLRETCGRS
jgi:hypothetical protein